MRWTLTFEERLLDKIRIHPTSECWEWTARINAAGYGVIRRGDTMVLSHRAAYELWCGQIPADLELDHLCRNRSCCNPLHLEPVTHAENCRRGVNVPPWADVNRHKTHCPAGHPYDATNTYIYADGSRSCRACNYESHRRRHKERTREPCV